MGATAPHSGAVTLNPFSPWAGALEFSFGGSDLPLNEGDQSPGNFGCLLFLAAGSASLSGGFPS